MTPTGRVDRKTDKEGASMPKTPFARATAALFMGMLVHRREAHRVAGGASEAQFLSKGIACKGTQIRPDRPARR